MDSLTAAIWIIGITLLVLVADFEHKIQKIKNLNQICQPIRKKALSWFKRIGQTDIKGWVIAIISTIAFYGIWYAFLNYNMLNLWGGFLIGLITGIIITPTKTYLKKPRKH